MLDDPELAGIIEVPLKAKLYRIDPGVKIFRCKVQTPPGKQFEIRAEAYRRIEAALKENGIAFADNTARVALYTSSGRISTVFTVPAWGESGSRRGLQVLDRVLQGPQVQGVADLEPVPGRVGDLGLGPAPLDPVDRPVRVLGRQ